MKVVLFSGGFGMRIREYAEDVPKPMVPIGYRPILWHVMKYYAHFGHTDFIVCLGYQGDVVKRYFLDYEECVSNDFVLSNGGRDVQLLNRDIQDWRITFVDTGLHASIGERLLAVRRHLEGEDAFLANYSDGLTDLHLPDLIAHHHQQGAVGTFACVTPSASFHLVDLDGAGRVTGIRDAARAGVLINGGYFVLGPEIFDNLYEGEDLVVEGFARLLKKDRLAAFHHEGFFACMDTFKEREQLQELYTSGAAPWMLWEAHRAPVRA